MHLQLFDLFANASSDFVVIIRTFIRQMLRSLVEHFQEAVVSGVDFQKLFIAIVSLTRQLSVILGLHFQAGIVFFPFDNFEKDKCRFTSKRRKPDKSLLLGLLW